MRQMPSWPSHHSHSGSDAFAARGFLVRLRGDPHGDSNRHWEVADVQIFPSTSGPSVEIVIRTEALGTASLFAVRPGKFKVASVIFTHKDDFNAAYWQVGEVAYALVAKAGCRELDKATTRIAKSLF